MLGSGLSNINKDTFTKEKKFDEHDHCTYVILHLNTHDALWISEYNEGSTISTSLKLSLQIIWIKNEMAQNRLRKFKNTKIELQLF